MNVQLKAADGVTNLYPEIIQTGFIENIYFDNSDESVPRQCIRFKNGLQICTGLVGNYIESTEWDRWGALDSTHIYYKNLVLGRNFLKAFLPKTYLNVQYTLDSDSALVWGGPIYFTNTTINSVYVLSNDINKRYAHISYLAVGYWKL